MLPVQDPVLHTTKLNREGKMAGGDGGVVGGGGGGERKRAHAR